MVELPANDQIDFLLSGSIAM